MSTCQKCHGTTELYLCNECTDELRDILENLPEWIGHLVDVALKRTRIGNGTKRSASDESPALYDGDTETGKATKQARAGQVLDDLRNDVITWQRHICETRGAEWIKIVDRAFVGPLLPGTYRGKPRPIVEDAAMWLGWHVHAIACDEGAGECLTTFKRYVEDIERIINPPERRVWLGNCPTWNEHTRQECGVSLWAPENAIEVYCRRCRRTHPCARLKLLLFNSLEREKVPWEKILRANKSQPPDRQVPERTLQSWRRTGRLKAAGYRRPNGRFGIHRHGDEDVELYLWPDVRKLRDAKPQKKTTGAAARKSLA